MSKPTDFNDQVNEQGRDGFADQINNDLAAIESAKKTNTSDVQAQLLVSDNPVSEQVPAQPVRDSDYDWRADMELTSNSDYKSSVRNAELVLRCDEQWLGVLGYCEFSYRIMKRSDPPMANCSAGEWEDSDTAALRVWMSHEHGFTPNHSDIADALVVVAKSNRFHPVRDYLDALEWDKTERLSHWLKTGLGATDKDDYLSIVGKKFLLGAVARVMRPGCKMDNVMILEGEQGRGKSTAVSVLFGEWFTDAPLPLGDKDAYQVIQGKWGFELAELDAFNKSEVTALKHFFSQQIDRFRPSYGRVALDHPRQTVFAGTTNQDAYLRDYTGNRRFWPVYTTLILLNWLHENRDQLWAEAVALFRQGEEWWVSADELEVVVEVQDTRLQRDPWEEIILEYVRGKSITSISTAQLLQDAIGFDPAHINQVSTNRIGPIMKSLGWINKREAYKGEDGKRKQRRIWITPQAEKALNEVPL